MKIRSLAYIDNELEDISKNPQDNLEDQEGYIVVEDEEDYDIVEDLTLDDISLHYVDATTGIKKATDTPSVFIANDGTTMLTGVIQIEGVYTTEQTDALISKGLLNKVAEFINKDPRINIDINSLITDKIHKGFISFVITPITASSRKKIIFAKAVDSEKIDKVCKSFFCKFNIDEDLSDFNINSANEELYNLLEKVAVTLSAIEKRKVMHQIKKKLAEHNVKLIYIENNLA